MQSSRTKSSSDMSTSKAKSFRWWGLQGAASRVQESYKRKVGNLSTCSDGQLLVIEAWPQADGMVAASNVKQPAVNSRVPGQQPGWFKHLCKI